MQGNGGELNHTEVVVNGAAVNEGALVFLDQLGESMCGTESKRPGEKPAKAI